MTESYIQQFKSLEAGPVAQFIKYGIAGGIATFTHVLIFYLVAWKLFPALQNNDLVINFLKFSVTEVDLATRSSNSMLSNGIAFICSNMVAYIINVFWVFKSGRHNRIIEIGLFYLVSGVSVLLGTCIMGFLIRYYGIQTTYAFSANIFVSAMINYAIRKFYIFNG